MADVLKLQFPDGSIKEFPSGTTTEEVAASISPGLRRNALAGKLDDELIDLKSPITKDGAIAIITPDSPEGLGILRHSTAHVLAQAVKRLFKGSKFGVGPAIDNGFYYDIDSPEPITAEDLVAIEKEMKKIVNENLEFIRHDVSRAEAERRFKEIGDEYKL